MRVVLLTLELRLEHDVVFARQRARQIAALLGFDEQDRTRIATSVSEMARNAYKYAGGGKVEFSVQTSPASLVTRVIDRGPGIADLDAVLEHRYTSTSGMGLGIVGVRRLMDSFDIESSPGIGTTVTLAKHVPRKAPAPTPEVLARVVDDLTRQRPGDPLEEVQQQNQELLRTLEELRAQKLQLAQINKELEDTNRGVVALYAELDEKADYLQRANEIKTRFLSNMTHEFRTPLNSITSLTRILLQRLDGELTEEQEKQIRFIAMSAGALTELVNDLLDLAKVEAGKILVRPTEFHVADLFAALRGMLRPLLAQNTAINLVFVEPEGVPVMHTDESKVSQILRNFISNAIKYTEHGEVTVSARAGAGNTVVFSVADTGIGIAPDDLERIFEEYTQVDSPLQRRVRGTGLGLPLSRKLAGLLGGSVQVRSDIGVGSTFHAIIPAEFRGSPEVVFVPEVSRQVDPTRVPVLVVEDNREALFVYEKFFKGTRYQVLPARTLKEAHHWLRMIQPVAIVLDILLEGESTWNFITEVRQHGKTRDIPIVVISMVENERRVLALGANAYHAKPVDRDWLIGKLDDLTRSCPHDTILIIDDDEVSRYLLRGLLAETRYRVVEAGSGREGLQLARETRPRAIFTDLLMPGMDGFAVVRTLKSEPELEDIPIIVHTAKHLTDDDRHALAQAVAILPKESPSREAAVASIRNVLIAAGLGYEVTDGNG